MLILLLHALGLLLGLGICHSPLERPESPKQRVMQAGVKQAGLCWLSGPAARATAPRCCEPHGATQQAGSWVGRCFSFEFS